MKFPQFFYVRNTSACLGASMSPQPTWIHPDDISTITTICERTPSIQIILRSDPSRLIKVGGPYASKILAQLEAFTDQ